MNMDHHKVIWSDSGDVFMMSPLPIFPTISPLVPLQPGTLGHPSKSLGDHFLVRCWDEFEMMHASSIPFPCLPPSPHPSPSSQSWLIPLNGTIQPRGGDRAKASEGRTLPIFLLLLTLFFLLFHLLFFLFNFFLYLILILLWHTIPTIFIKVNCIFIVHFQCLISSFLWDCLKNTWPLVVVS